MKRVLIAGVSTRAAAESAARAGFAVTGLDAFADLDQHPSVHALSVTRDFGLRLSPGTTARIVQTINSDAVAYLSPFENHPPMVQSMASGRALWGNPPATLRRVRDPFLLADTFSRHGFAVPGIRPNGPNESNDSNDPNASWLLKPRASGGGRGVEPWTPGATVPRRSVLQERIDGTPGSIVFAAARGQAVPIGFSRQLVGVAAFGATGYRYCGSIMSAVSDPQFEREQEVFAMARAMADVATKEFGLVGLNGIDFVARDGVAFPLEVNPRWSASMELVERGYGLSVFGAHASACTGYLLPFDVEHARRQRGATGKAIVFARRDVVAGATRRWLDQPDVRDIPRPGDRIRAGEPVCTVFADAPDAASCETALIARAAHVYADLERWSDDSRARVRRRRVASEVVPALNPRSVRRVCDRRVQSAVRHQRGLQPTYNVGMADDAQLLAVSLEPIPAVDAYKRDVDRTLIRENLKLTTDERVRKMISALRFAEEVRRSRKLTP